MRLNRLFFAIPGLLLTLNTWAGAPDIPLHDLSGQQHNVNEYIGHAQWTVVVAWAHDCSICAREIGEMSAFHKSHHDKDAIVLGISLDGADHLSEARAFVQEHALPFVNLITEPSQATMQKFGAGRFVGTPTYYVFDPRGDIVGQNIGPITRLEVEEFIESFNKPVATDE